MILALLSACSEPEPTCSEETCAEPDDTDTTTSSVGNDVALDGYPPVVVTSEPIAGAIGVDVATDVVGVTFSLDMERGQSWVSVDAFFPEFVGAGYVDARTNEVNGVSLDADSRYHVWVNSPFGTYTSFASLQGLSALPWSLAFSTGADPAALDDFPTVVVGTDPVAGTDGVDPALEAVTLRFSNELVPGLVGLRRDAPETDPGAGDAEFVSATEVRVPVTLEPGTTYALWINEDAEGFEDESGRPVVPYLLTFRTQEPD